MIVITLIVIRISKNSTINDYTISNSKPYVGCVYRMKHLFEKGYRINKIYYSNENGKLEHYQFNSFIKRKQIKSSYYKNSPLPNKYIREFEI